MQSQIKDQWLIALTRTIRNELLDSWMLSRHLDGRQGANGNVGRQVALLRPKWIAITLSSSSFFSSSSSSSSLSSFHHCKLRCVITMLLHRIYNNWSARVTCFGEVQCADSRAPVIHCTSIRCVLMTHTHVFVMITWRYEALTSFIVPAVRLSPGIQYTCSRQI